MTVRVWNASNGEELKKIQLTATIPNSVSFNNSGTRIAIGLSTGCTMVVNISLPTSNAVRVQNSSDSIVVLQNKFSNGNAHDAPELLACGGSLGEIVLRDFSNGTQRTVRPANTRGDVVAERGFTDLDQVQDSVLDVSFTTNNRGLVVGAMNSSYNLKTNGDAVLFLYSVQTKELSDVIRLQMSEGETLWSHAMAISPDGMKAVTSSSSGKKLPTLRFWETGIDSFLRDREEVAEKNQKEAEDRKLRMEKQKLKNAKRVEEMKRKKKEKTLQKKAAAVPVSVPKP